MVTQQVRSCHMVVHQFAATTTSGIIFSFNAFQTIINMGSEIKILRKILHVVLRFRLH